MRIDFNIIANYASRLWAGVSTFVFVPLYLRILGPEPFGLITFSASLLALVFILDMGMSNAFAREVARQQDATRLADLLRSLEWLYVAVIALVVLVAIVGSPIIAKRWLNVSHLAPERVRWSVALMLISAILQVMMALYIGGLLGANRHVAAAGYQIGFSIVRSGFILIPLYFFPRVELVFVWQVVASLLCLLLLRHSVWKSIDAARRPSFSRDALRQVSGFASGMFGIALISAINTQSDKLVVSKIFSLEAFGFYSIGSLLGQIPPMLALPLAVTVLPRLTGHIARDDRDDLATIYMHFSFMIATVASVAMIGVLIGTAEILTVIKGTLPAPELVAVTRILTVGGALLAAQYMPYHLAVASGHTRTNFQFGIVSAIVLPLAMAVLAGRAGLVGVAVPWVVMNAIAAVFLAWRIMPRFLGPHLTEWVLKANILPLLLSAVVIYPAMFAMVGIRSPLLSLMTLAVFCAAALLLNGLVFMRLFHPRPQLLAKVSK